MDVRNDSAEPGSPLYPDSPGNRLKAYLLDVPDLLVTKQVNSSFHGHPDLHAWLQSEGITGIVVCGTTTNHCCETTARVGGNLGYDVLFALDATHTFDRTGPDDTTRSGDLRGEGVPDGSVDVDAGRGEDRDRAVGLADEELDLGAAEDDSLCAALDQP